MSAFDVGLRAGAAERARSSTASDARAVKQDWDRVTAYLESAAKRVAAEQNSGDARVNSTSAAEHSRKRESGGTGRRAAERA